MKTSVIGFVSIAAAFGQSLMPVAYLTEISTAGPASVKRVGAGLRPFSEALSIDTQQPGLTMNDSRLEWVNTQAINKLDRLRLTFWTRKTAPQDGFNLRDNVSLESMEGPPLLDTVFPVKTEAWTFYGFDVTADSAYAPGDLRAGTLPKSRPLLPLAPPPPIDR